MSSYDSQVFLLSAFGPLLYYILLIVISLVMSLLSVKLLNKTITKSDTATLTKNYTKKLFLYSVLSFTTGFMIVVIISEYFNPNGLYEGLDKLFMYFWELSFMPDYSDSGSVLFVFGIIAISFLFNLIFDFLLVFRKIELSIMKKFLCALISAIMVSPYALLIHSIVFNVSKYNRYGGVALTAPIISAYAIEDIFNILKNIILTKT